MTSSGRCAENAPACLSLSLSLSVSLFLSVFPSLPIRVSLYIHLNPEDSESEILLPALASAISRRHRRSNIANAKGRET